jgi:RNA polymerase sigma-70 factor (ECF subfamily)
MDAQEREWLEQYRRGNREALGRLVEHYRRPLYSFILRMTEGRVDADEIFQEVWVRAIRNLDTFREENLLGWLFRIAHNLIIDHARRRKLFADMESGRTTSTTRSSWLAQVADSNIGPATEVAGRDLGARIRQALAKLPPEQREVFLLRTEGGVPFKEIARIQRVSLNTALARMHYAVLKLREALKDDYRTFGGNAP